MSIKTALIVGAGIGGLSAAVALRRAGWRVRVFERAGSPRELGFGLMMAPNAIAALRALGVAETVIERSYASDVPRGELRRPDGTMIKRGEFPFRAAFGAPMVIGLRPALHGALLDAAGTDSIATNAEATGFTADGRGVFLHLANGEQVRGDVLIGADGIGSVVRRQLHPSEPPARASGIVALRGAVHGMQQHLGDMAAICYLGPGIESVFTRASATGIYWFASVAREFVPDGMREPAAVLAHLAPRFDATFRAVTSATDDLRFDELVDRDPIPSWGGGPVTLLGDAAHPLLPQTGQGAAQAIIDGVTLGRVLGGATDVEDALRAYERERQPKTAALLQQGRRTARMMRMTNPTACALREFAIRLVPVKPLAKIYVRLNKRAGTEA